MSDLNTTLEALHPESWALIEYFASWCPACMKFAPEYDKIARFLLTSKIDDQPVFVGRVDCAKEIAVCELYKITGFPTMLLGAPGAFMTVQLPNLQRFSPHPIKDAAGIVRWIAKKTNSTLAYVNPDAVPGEAAEPVAHPAFADLSDVDDPPDKVWEMQDVEGATVHLWRIFTSTPSLHTGLAKRSAFHSQLALWSVAHPSPKCQKSSSLILSKYDAIWSVDTLKAPVALLHHAMCGTTAAASDINWKLCQGSRSSTRGYTCGLWLLLHTTSARLPDSAASGKLFMTAVLAFNDHFFQCEACRDHFSGLLAAPEAQLVETRRDAVLWVWRAHNEVNARLATEDHQGLTGDPAHPKVQWPGSAACPSCRLPQLGVQEPVKEGGAEGVLNAANIKWNLDEVYPYLVRAFGGELVPVAVASAVKLPVELGSAPRVSTHLLERPEASDSPPPRAFNMLPVWILLGGLVLGMAYYAVTKSAANRRNMSRARSSAGGGDDPNR